MPSPMISVVTFTASSESPLNSIGMAVVLQNIEAAAASGTRFVISTVNLNFIVNSQTDPEFRESLLLSDLCSPDGISLVWLARFMGIPIKRTVSGSDIFEALDLQHNSERRLSVFLFGATEQVAAAACQRLNDYPSGLKCVGWICPGFGSVDDLSKDHIINEINVSNADFLMAALGANKGQLWLKRNHNRLQIPVRAHLGATINFKAGVINRAPLAVRRMGLEWLWRIKEEPYLWRRYWHDGYALLRLFVTSVLPLAFDIRWRKLRRLRDRDDFAVTQVRNDGLLTLRISGDATVAGVTRAIPYFREAIAGHKQINIDLSQTRWLDARFLGLLLMLKKQLAGGGGALRVIGVTQALRRQFWLNRAEYLLSQNEADTNSHENEGK